MTNPNQDDQMNNTGGENTPSPMNESGGETGNHGFLKLVIMNNNFAMTAGAGTSNLAPQSPLLHHGKSERTAKNDFEAIEETKRDEIITNRSKIRMKHREEGKKRRRGSIVKSVKNS